MPAIRIFKRCPCCGTKWTSRDSFIKDDTLELNGYQADCEEMDKGLFFFTHRVTGCCSTMAVEARDFFSLYDGPRYSKVKMGSDECPGYCLDKERLDPCSVRCEYAYVREVVQKIKEHKRA